MAASIPGEKLVSLHLLSQASSVLITKAADSLGGLGSKGEVHQTAVGDCRGKQAACNTQSTSVKDAPEVTLPDLLLYLGREVEELPVHLQTR